MLWRLAAVAIEKPARLATAGLTIRADGLDKNAKLEDFAHNEVDFTNGFQVTAVLVGNQKAVSWDFKPGGTKEYTSYHRIYNPTTAAAATFKKARSTEDIPLNLLPTDQYSVSFALELLNNCPDFVGKDGQIIPNNAVFYLPVTLKSSDGSPILPSGVQMTASLSILPQTGLRNAVLEVPDLNASQEYNESFTISRTTL